MNKRHRDRYMRAAARITCPVALRRAMRRGVNGVQVVRRRSQITNSAISASIRSRRPGWSASLRTTSEPLETVLQKKSVAEVPKRPPAGTA